MVWSVWRDAFWTTDWKLKQIAMQDPSAQNNCWVIFSVSISGYPLSGYPDLSVNFKAAKNPDILKWKSGCFGCLQNLCKLCLWYCGGTSNYSKSNSHASKEWMVTLVNQTRSKECLLTLFSIYLQFLVLLVFTYFEVLKVHVSLSVSRMRLWEGL